MLTFRLPPGVALALMGIAAIIVAATLLPHLDYVFGTDAEKLGLVRAGEAPSNETLQIGYFAGAYLGLNVAYMVIQVIVNKARANKQLQKPGY